jgi:hypothetical protein
LPNDRFAPQAVMVIASGSLCLSGIAAEPIYSPIARECEEHRWMQDRATRMPAIARSPPRSCPSPDEAVAEIRNALDSIGASCPECPSNV